jgi:hypothetical protein
MEYLWTFLIVTWFTGEDMKIVTQNAPSYEACELMRVEQEMLNEDRAKLSDGSFVWYVGDCTATPVYPSDS